MKISSNLNLLHNSNVINYSYGDQRRYVVEFEDNDMTTPWHDIIKMAKEVPCTYRNNIDGLVQNRSNSSANALELLRYCRKPSIYED